MIKALRKLAWIEDPGCVAYLTPLLRLLRRQGRLVVATLNYDNAIELLAESHDVPCHDGLVEWAWTGDCDVVGDGLILLKLHGSIDWERRVDRSRMDRLPHTLIWKRSREEMLYGDVVGYREQVDGTEAPVRYFREFTPALIFGKGNKLTAEGPFLDLLRAFRDELSQVELLTIIGYSFRDPHVNEYLTTWLTVEPDRRIRIISGPDFERKATGYARLLLQHVPHQVEVIPAYAKDALAELWA